MMKRDRLPSPPLRTLAWLLTLAVAAPLKSATAQDLRQDLRQDLPVAARDTARHPGQEGLPLRPDRYLEFTASEGTWISLDVSPDGREIVFDLLGDIYLMPITGGAARPLTHGMGAAAMPRFSPDGQRVVFVSDRDGGNNVWIVSTDLRDTVQVTRGKTSSYESPIFTPDGDYVIVTRDNRLHMYHVQGGSGVQLIKEPANLRAMGAAFGADPRWIWYAEVGRAPFLNEWLLASFDRETGQTQERSNHSYGIRGAFRPTLSPDGRWLVYGTRHIAETGLRIRDLATGDERWLAYPVHRDEQESKASNDVYPGMAFTPDSRHLVATYGGRIWRIPVDGGDATEIPFAAPVRIPMGPRVAFEYELEDTPTFVARQIREAVPSPDGQRLAFSAMGRLYITEWPDGTPRRLTSSTLNEHHPTWSPDGRWIAYTTWSHAEGGHIWRVRADGRQPPQRLTTASAAYEQLVFSPAGDRIVALRGPAAEFANVLGFLAFPVDIVWIPATGGPATEIAPTRRWPSNPHFTSDPDRIYFAGQGSVSSMRWDGTDERVHVRITSGAGTGGSPAAWVRMSPDGTRALARVRMDLFVVTVPVTGEPPTIGVGNPEGAPFPVRRLTDIGGEFPAWSGDGRRVHWSIGNAHVVYDLDRAQAFDDSVRVANGARAQQQAPYEPLERRVHVVVERDIPVGEIVLRGARAITMRGDEIIDDADIVVRGNRIVAVGARGSVQHAPGARIIDVAGKTVLPGFVDTHAHHRPSVTLHRDQVWSYAANLAYGVTTTRNPQVGTEVLSYADRVDAGDILGPRIFSTGRGVMASDQIRDLDHARRVLRRYSDYYGTNTIKQYRAGNREQRQWIIQAARELRLMPTTEGDEDFRMGIQEAIDGYSGHEHTWPAFPYYSDLFRLFADAQIYYTPTILVAYGGPWAENHFFATEDVLGDRKLRTFTPFQEIERKALRRGRWFHPDVHVFRQISEQVKGLLEHGGVAAVGSHGQLQGLGYHWELWAMQSGGLDEHSALRAATLMGAQAIGHARDLGSLEPGKLADIVVLDGNPLEDIRNSNTVRFVMKNGRLYDGDTLDEIAPRPRRNGPFYWADYEPTGVRAGERR